MGKLSSIVEVTGLDGQMHYFSAVEVSAVTVRGDRPSLKLNANEMLQTLRATKGICIEARAKVGSMVQKGKP